jgi:long-chain acyl-CoA synthetase
LLSEVAPTSAEEHDVRAFIFNVRGFASDIEAPTRPLPEVQTDEPAVIVYTSGTTARPKGVTHSHRTALRVARGAGVGSDGVVAIATPMAHMAGLAMLLSTLDAGATAVMSARFDADRLLDDIASHGCTDMAAMPVMYQQLCTAQLERPRAVSSLRKCAAGGDSVAPALKATFVKAFGCPLYEIYASTELGIVAANWSVSAPVRGSCGSAMPDVEIAIADATRDVRGASGECIVRSPGMMIGYWRDPDATAAVVKDGWFHTGDLMRQDSMGYLWFEGRRKEIIIRGGSNIAPQEVEAALYQHPGVLEAGVVGVPDPAWGERVVAFVSRTPGSGIQADELIAFVGGRLSAYKTPEQIVFLETLPKSPAGKVQRRALREMLTAPTERPALTVSDAAEK